MWITASREQVTSAVLLLSCAALIVAWIGEYIFGLQACSLCLYQRYIYIFTISLLAVHLFFFGARYPRFFLPLSALLLLSCAGVSAYQVAVEEGWVAVPSICKAPSIADSLEAFKQMVTTKSYVPCDEVQWSLFRISIAGYNVLFATTLALITFWGTFLDDKKKKKFTRR